MGSKAATKSREQKRTKQTVELMDNIMSGGEISKSREAQLARAADYGRGVKLSDSGDQYGQRIIASQPTLREVGGDFKRAVFGGKSKDPTYLKSGQTAAPGKTTEDFKQYTPPPREEKGIIPNIIEAGITPMGIIAKQLMGKKKVEPKETAKTLLAKKRQGYQDDPYSVPSNNTTILGGSKSGKKTTLGQ